MDARRTRRRAAAISGRPAAHACRRRAALRAFRRERSGGLDLCDRARTEAAHSLAFNPAQVTFCGHVHQPAIYSMSATAKMTAFTPTTGVAVPLLQGRRWLAVLGSVGQPRDGNPAAAYAMLDTDKRELTYCRAPYDVEQAAAAIRKKGLPTWLADRLFAGTMNMAKPLHEPGVVVDGFRLEEIAHQGGMATLWRVSRPGTTTPMLMKVPRIGEGTDPAAIVSFEMEQMIMPRLSGVHVPKCIAVGDFATQPYIVDGMHRRARLCYTRLRELPLPYAEVAEIGVKIAQALDDLHRQHVVHLDIKPSNIMFRPTGEAVLLDFGLSHHDQLPDLMQEEFRAAVRHGALYVAGTIARHPQRSAQRPVRLGRAALFLFDRRAAVRRKRDAARHAPPALARPGAAAPVAARLSALAAGDRAALPRDRTGLALSDSGATRLRSEPPERGQADRPLRTSAARSADHRPAPAVQQGPDAAARQAGARRPTCRRRRSSPSPSIWPKARRRSTTRCASPPGACWRRLPSARLACLNVLKQGRLTIDFTLDEHGHNRQIDRLVGLRHWAEPLKLEEAPPHRARARSASIRPPPFSNSRRANRVDHILIGARQNSLMRTLLGSVSAKVAAEALCTVTVVRPNSAAAEEKSSAAEDPGSAVGRRQA